MSSVSPTGATHADSPAERDDDEADGKLARGSLVGRYIVLERVGAGGMGVVYAAYDPDLDRRVALKIVQPKRSRSPDALTRMLREAQALAKLAHPNVVAVHDVGEANGGVFLAMEFVRGKTLAQWRARETPDWRRILEVMLAVGGGLAAAHDKGLVHRDIKPDNVMIDDDDGRVRVMDFGLARPSGASSEAVQSGPDKDLDIESPASPMALTRDGAIMGTPSYMSPEQFAGGTVGAAADQFAYCVTLWEALYGRRPFIASTVEAMSIAVTNGNIEPPPRTTEVPGWVHRVVLRGLAVDPAARWPSMRALLDALGDDPRPRRRRWLTVAAIALGGLAIALGQRWDEQRRAAACVAAGNELDDEWSPAIAEDVRQRMIASGVTDAEATFARTASWLDRYADSWREAATEACTAATIEHRYDVDMRARAQDCLAERSAELGELVRLLLTPTADIVREAVVSASELTPVASCRDSRQLLRAPMIGDERRADATAVRELLARASVGRHSGDPAGGLLQAESALTAAEALQFPPLVARAHLELGAAHRRRDEAEEAKPHLRDAYRLAASTGADEIAADAARELVYVTGYQLEKHDESSLWYDVAASLLDRLDLPPDDGRRAELMSERAAVRAVSGEIREARTDFEAVLEIQLAQVGEDHPRVVETLGALSVAEHQLGDHVAAEATATRALAILGRIYGDAHPERAMVLAGYAAVLEALGRHDESIAAARDALAIHEGSFGREHPAVAGALNNLAMMLGGGEEANTLLLRALAITEKVRGPKHREVAYCLNNLGFIAARRGDLAAAVAHHERAVAILEAIPEGDAVALSHTLSNLGDELEQSGKHDEAHAVYRRALPVAERAFGTGHAFVASVQAALGRGHVRTGDYRGAVELLEKAVAVSETSPNPPVHNARDRMYLARAKLMLGGDRAAARTEIERAFAIFVEHDADNLIAIAKTWLADD